MMRSPDEIVAAARGCLGARFRPHGRRPEHGLDCVGVAAVAFGRAVPSDYPLHGGEPARVVGAIDAAGLARVAGVPRAGDLVLLDAGAGQLHLAVLSGCGFIHADVRLRRVVETPGPPTLPLLAAWRDRDGREGD